MLIHSDRPINRDQFKGLFEGAAIVEEGTNAHRVPTFLLERSDEAFKQGEIATETGVPRGSIRIVLRRLEERGLVEHERQWWAVAADDRITAYEGMISSSRAVADREPDIDVEAWKEHAVDPRG
jgi:transcription initiation factor IIE alpha subunit